MCLPLHFREAHLMSIVQSPLGQGNRISLRIAVRHCRLNLHWKNRCPCVFVAPSSHKAQGPRWASHGLSVVANLHWIASHKMNRCRGILRDPESSEDQSTFGPGGSNNLYSAWVVGCPCSNLQIMRSSPPCIVGKVCVISKHSKSVMGGQCQSPPWITALSLDDSSKPSNLGFFFFGKCKFN